MATKKAQAKGSGGNGDGQALAQFLLSLEALPELITDAMIRQAGDEDHKVAIRAYGQALQQQVQGLSSFIHEGWERSSLQGRAEVMRVLAISGSTALLSGISTLTKSMQSQTARISVSGITGELKKLIKLIISLFGSIPSWLDTLLALIDEVLNGLLSVGIPGLASTLSRSHQDYLNEQILLARLNREQGASQQSAEKESGGENS